MVVSAFAPGVYGRIDASARQAFLNEVAGPIANKMFECGMIP